MNRTIPIDDLDAVVYHQYCQDGINAALIFKHECKKYYRNIELIQTYPDGNNLNIALLRNKNVILVDVTTELVDEIIKITNKCLILDHHKSAYNTYKDNEHCYYDLTKCGTTIAYEYVYPNQPIPKFIKCIESRDLWTWTEEGAKEFTAGYYEVTRNLPIEEYYKIFKQLIEDDDHLTKFYEIKRIGREKIEHDDAIVKKTYDKSIITPVIVNEKQYNIIKISANPVTYTLRSNIGDYAMKHANIDFCVIYIYNEENEEYYCSLRSKEGKTDLVAEGLALGHPYAAGLTINEHPDNHFVNV
jgi:nanoRNase/pAp phosphatase (c-di-AMP/oligoRNAs hydrolase)